MLGIIPKLCIPFLTIIIVQWTLASHTLQMAKSYIRFGGVVTHTSASSTIDSTDALSPHNHGSVENYLERKLQLEGFHDYGGKGTSQSAIHTCHTVWHEVVP